MLEGFAFNPDEFEQKVIEMPLNMRSIQDHALKRSRWGSRKPLSVWDAFARLPNYQQEMILTILAERKRQLYDYTRDDPPLPPQLVLISLNVAKYRWRRFLEALRRFGDFDFGNAPKRRMLFIVIARVTQPHSNGSEPLISSTKPWRRPSKADRDDSESTSSNDPSSSPSRSRRRSRVRYSRSRSRSRTRGHRRGLVVAAARGLKAAYQNRKSERFAEERRSRRRSRRRRYSLDSDPMHEAYGGAQARAAEAAGAQQSTGRYDYAANPTGYPSSSIGTEAPKAGDQGDDESQLRRVTTLNETDGNEPSTVPPPPPQREPTVIETDKIALPPPFSPPQRATTFQEDVNSGGRSVGGQALAALGLRSTSRRGRDASRPTENKIARKNTGPRSSRDLRVTRGERSRRDRSRSRSRSRAMVPRLSKWRNRSSSKQRRNSRSNKEGTAMQLFRKSPERPILRTYTDDGVPPTQRDKAAVAEYYLKKWTTAYDHVRAQNLGRRYTTRAAGRSRSRLVPDRGLIEYGNEPVYGSQAPYYPPPPGQGGYYDANPYQGAYNPADYYPAGVRTSGAGAADVSPYKAQGQKTSEGRDRDRDRDTSESDDGRRRRHSRKEDDSGASDEQAQTYTTHSTPGNVHTDDEEEEEKHPTPPPAGLTVPSHQRAYAESVPDNGNEKEDFVEEVE